MAKTLVRLLPEVGVMRHKPVVFCLLALMLSRMLLAAKPASSTAPELLLGNANLEWAERELPVRLMDGALRRTSLSMSRYGTWLANFRDAEPSLTTSSD